MLEKHPELDACDVCVWNCSHAKCSIAALNAGKHVLCEKPMAYNANEAEEMIAARDKSGKVLMIGFVMRFTDEGKIAKEFVDEDYLGDIYYARAHYVRRHGSPGGWFANKELSGGGPIIDLGVHVIDFTRYLAGSPKPVSVYAAAFDNIGNRPDLKNTVGWSPKGSKPTDPNTVEDFGTALIRYENGFVTHLECSYDVNALSRNAKEIYGTKGGLDLTSGVKLYTNVNGFLSDVNVNVSNYKEANDCFDAEMLHFIRCARGEEECRATAEDGLVVMKILDAIYKSAECGHEVIL
jgi:predicted dehydrogenase